MIAHGNLKYYYSPDWQAAPGSSYFTLFQQKKAKVNSCLGCFGREYFAFFTAPDLPEPWPTQPALGPDRAAIRPKTLVRNVLVCWPYHSNMSLFTLMRTTVGELRARLDTHRLRTDPAFVFYAGFSRRPERSRESFSAGSPNIGVFTRL